MYKQMKETINMKCLVKVPESQSQILKVTHLWLLFAEASAYYHPMRIQNKEAFVESQISTNSFQSLLTLKEVLTHSRIAILEYNETDIGEALMHTVRGKEPYDDGKSHRTIQLKGVASIDATKLNKNLTVKFDSTEHTINNKKFGGETPLILKPQIQGAEIVCNPNGITGIGKENNTYLMLV